MLKNKVMKVIKKEKEAYTNHILLFQNAQAWYKIYLYLLKDIRTSFDFLTQRFVSLIFAIELYLKSYLCFLDKKYEKVNKLRNLSHRIDKICNEIIKRDKDFIKFEKIFKEFNYFRDSYTLLRYPEVGNLIEGLSLFKIEDFEEMIEYIKKNQREKKSVNK